jgi:hypothetical protein
MSNGDYIDSGNNSLPINYAEGQTTYDSAPQHDHRYREVAVLTNEDADMQPLLQKQCSEKLELGAVFKDISSFFVEKIGNEVLVHELSYSRVVVLSQACDLEWNNKSRTAENGTHDKVMLTVLVAPFFDSVKASEGKHMAGFKMKMEAITRKIRDRARKGDIARHHILTPEMFKENGTKVGFEEGVVDFKHYFTVPAHSLCEDKYIDSLKLFYREKLSQRFSSFLSRIGIPENYSG